MENSRRRKSLNRSTYVVEDVAIVLDEVAVLATMGAESRREEPIGIELLDISEFAKAEGGVTCLSILFE